MAAAVRRHLYLPARDRSFWKADEEVQPLQYLAWGTRDFHRQPIPASRHEGWVCVLIEEGAPTMVVRRQAVRMPAGTLALVGPDCPFGWRGAASGASRFRLWMWRALDAGTRLPGTPGAGAAWASRLLARHERPAFLDLHDLCRREVLRTAGPDPAYLEGCRLLFDVAVRRALTDPDDPDGHAPDIAAVAREWLRQHLDSREPIARLCDYLDVSQSTLHRLFTRAEGVSPQAWFHRTRMARAADLLASGTLSVKEVAHTLGYEHANDLSRAYKQYYGRRAGGQEGRKAGGNQEGNQRGNQGGNQGGST